MKKFCVEISLIGVTGQFDLARMVVHAMQSMAASAGDMRDYQIDVREAEHVDGKHYIRIDWTEWPEEAKAIFKRQAA